jgi:hypothetical protein
LLISLSHQHVDLLSGLFLYICCILKLNQKYNLQQYRIRWLEL